MPTDWPKVLTIRTCDGRGTRRCKARWFLHNHHQNNHKER